jgi:hypothetical protein
MGVLLRGVSWKRSWYRVSRRSISCRYSAGTFSKNVCHEEILELPLGVKFLTISCLLFPLLLSQTQPAQMPLLHEFPSLWPDRSVSVRFYKVKHVFFSFSTKDWERRKRRERNNGVMKAGPRCLFWANICCCTSFWARKISNKIATHARSLIGSREWGSISIKSFSRFLYCSILSKLKINKVCQIKKLGFYKLFTAVY